MSAESVVTAQQPAEKINTGAVIEQVTSAVDPTKSYALYLPTAYTATRKFPILYCFDPLARGSVPVSRFKEAAEKYNYIVVGSNNSRNGTNVPVSEIVRDLWEDTHARFAIDERRVYLAGFSGGARVAISVAFWLKEHVAGVIACGGGFPANLSLTTPRPFVLFAVAGTDDFNNPEMQTLVRKLEGSSPPSRLAIFEGGHAWLPVQLATEAVLWLELQAMKAGIRDRNQVLIDESFQHALSQALAAQNAGDEYRAYQSYAAMAGDFAGLHDVAEVENRANELRVTREINQAIKQERKLEEDQARRIQSIHSLIGGRRGSEDSQDSMSALRDELKSQRDAARASEPSARRTVARRVMESIFIEFVELGNMALARKEYANAVSDYLICTEIQPDNGRAFYYLARAQALAGSRSKAIDALRAAADKGFTGVQELSAREFEALQNDKRFKEILDAVRENQLNQKTR
jgi:poly(3-hydroxybutyrate) depolymerase